MFSVGDASGEGGREETDFGRVGVVEEDEEEDGDEVDKASGDGTDGGGVDATVDAESCCGEDRGVMDEVEDWSRVDETGDAKEVPLGLLSCRSSRPRASSRSVLLSW